MRSGWRTGDLSLPHGTDGGRGTAGRGSFDRVVGARDVQGSVIGGFHVQCCGAFNGPIGTDTKMRARVGGHREGGAHRLIGGLGSGAEVARPPEEVCGRFAAGWVEPSSVETTVEPTRGKKQTGGGESMSAQVAAFPHVSIGGSRLSGERILTARRGTTHVTFAMRTDELPGIVHRHPELGQDALPPDGPQAATHTWRGGTELPRPSWALSRRGPLGRARMVRTPWVARAVRRCSTQSMLSPESSSASRPHGPGCSMTIHAVADGADPARGSWVSTER